MFGLLMTQQYLNDTLTTRFIVAGNITVNSVHPKHLFQLKRLP